MLLRKNSYFKMDPFHKTFELLMSLLFLPQELWGKSSRALHTLVASSGVERLVDILIIFSNKLPNNSFVIFQNLHFQCSAD